MALIEGPGQGKSVYSDEQCPQRGAGLTHHVTSASTIFCAHCGAWTIFRRISAHASKPVEKADSQEWLLQLYSTARAERERLGLAPADEPPILRVPAWVGLLPLLGHENDMDARTIHPEPHLVPHSHLIPEDP